MILNREAKIGLIEEGVFEHRFERNERRASVGV